VDGSKLRAPPQEFETAGDKRSKPLGRTSTTLTPVRFAAAVLEIVSVSVVSLPTGSELAPKVFEMVGGVGAVLRQPVTTTSSIKALEF
jgi:hypothetical protein